MKAKDLQIIQADHVAAIGPSPGWSLPFFNCWQEPKQDYPLHRKFTSSKHWGGELAQRPWKWHREGRNTWLFCLGCQDLANNVGLALIFSMMPPLLHVHKFGYIFTVFYLLFFLTSVISKQWSFDTLYMHNFNRYILNPL